MSIADDTEVLSQFAEENAAENKNKKRRIKMSETKTMPRVSVKFKLKSNTYLVDEAWLATDVTPDLTIEQVFHSLVQTGKSLLPDIEQKQAYKPVPVQQQQDIPDFGTENPVCPTCKSATNLSYNKQYYNCSKQNAFWDKERKEMIHRDGSCKGYVKK